MIILGQYFRPILGDEFGLNCKVFDRSVNGEYTLAKLMEHSWWQNPFVNAFSEFLYNEPSRVAWVGDYADEPDDLLCVLCALLQRSVGRNDSAGRRRFF